MTNDLKVDQEKRQKLRKQYGMAISSRRSIEAQFEDDEKTIKKIKKTQELMINAINSEFCYNLKRCLDNVPEDFRKEICIRFGIKNDEFLRVFL